MVKEDKDAQGYTELEWSEARADAVLASLGEGLIVTDRKGKIVLINRAAEELTGWMQEEVKGKFVTDAIPKEDSDGKVVSFKDRILQKVLAGEKFSVDTIKPYWFRHRNGEKFPVSLVVTPITIEGATIGAVEVFRDVTKEQELETAKNEFVSLASHQLRTPLSTVAWYAEMLLAGDAGTISEEQENFIQEIYQGNKRMISLVNALLNVSRIEAGTLFVSNEEVDLVRVIDEALKELTSFIQEKKLIIQKKYQSDEVFVIQADKEIVHIIVQNLLSNAVKYTGEGGTVTVGLAASEDATSLFVTDTGYGIPKDQQDKIFTKLFRADNIQGMVTDGTGLGLYMVKKMLDKLGGSISFESEENKGSTFYVAWPRDGMREQAGQKRLAVHKSIVDKS
ncbi:MAG: ATP-binding protein [Candidatus Paceibacterota bacterium]